MKRPAPLRFDACELDAAHRRLTRDGRPVEVQPKVFDLLVYLIEHRDRVVSCDELLLAIWGGVVVTPSSLSQAVHRARLAVGDDGERQRVIGTVHARGFRFVAPLGREGAAREADAHEGDPVQRELARLRAAVSQLVASLADGARVPPPARFAAAGFGSRNGHVPVKLRDEARTIIDRDGARPRPKGPGRASGAHEAHKERRR